MGIQSTRTISREHAIERIQKIHALVLLRDYRGLEQTTFEESGRSLQDFVNQEEVLTSDLSRWTNDMLAKQMDQPYYRMSYFDNYEVEDAPSDKD